MSASPSRVSGSIVRPKTRLNPLEYTKIPQLLDQRFPAQDRHHPHQVKAGGQQRTLRLRPTPPPQQKSIRLEVPFDVSKGMFDPLLPLGIDVLRGLVLRLQFLLKLFLRYPDNLPPLARRR